MERPKRKAINFDLDTNIMKDHRLYPNGYELLRVSFKNQGFEHRQGSGYLSTGKLTSDQVYEIVEEIVKEQPWLADCVKKIDVTDIGRQHDLTAVVKSLAAQQSELIDQRSGNLSDRPTQRQFVGNTERGGCSKQKASYRGGTHSARNENKREEDRRGVW